MSDQKKEYVFGNCELGLTFVVEGTYSTNEELSNASSILLEWWDYMEPDENCSTRKEPVYNEYGIWREPAPIAKDIWHEPIYNDYEIWQDPNGYADTISEKFQCNFDQQTTAENDSQIVSQEDTIDEFFVIKKDTASLEDLRYYSNRDDITEPKLVDQFNSFSRNNKEKVVEEDSEFMANFNDWINFDSIDHEAFFNSCKLIWLATEI
ncbi:hypothetical protein MFLAVUS_007285 [Mucor flavus]|uniref:Uncharacterized protein n=1 Tax=Mucor flavus TaxID=439312 RepID=A0ABP9Z3V1_9FUNG